MASSGDKRFAELREDAFYNKKINHFARVRDVDNNGRIQRADFDLVNQRFKELGARAHMRSG